MSQAVPSPVGRERVRVRVVSLEIRLLSGTCACTNRYLPGAHGSSNSAACSPICSRRWFPCLAPIFPVRSKKSLVPLTRTRLSAGRFPTRVSFWNRAMSSPFSAVRMSRRPSTAAIWRRCSPPGIAVLRCVSATSAGRATRSILNRATWVFHHSKSTSIARASPSSHSNLAAAKR